MFSHGGNVGSRCADHAAAMRAFGCVSSFNLVERWPPPDRTLPLLKVEPAAFVDIEIRLEVARRELTRL